MNELTDLELIEHILEGEQAALMALYDRHVKAVYSLTLRVLGQRHLAEEVTQDVFMKVWRKAELWQPERGRFISWLLTVARNTALDRIRKEEIRTPRLAIPWEMISNTLGNPSHIHSLSWENGHLLRSLLEQLPVEQQKVIVLAYYGGMSHREFAQHLDLPLGTVKTRIQLGMEKLRILWRNAYASMQDSQ